MYKFEKLEVYQLALTYTDMIYSLVESLPNCEEGNLRSQLVRAATSIVLNIAEGSTSQTNMEQRRFLGMAVRSLIETVACQHIVQRRNYVTKQELAERYDFSRLLFAKLQAMRRALEKRPAGDR